jgi:hypothetical protein
MFAVRYQNDHPPTQIYGDSLNIIDEDVETVKLTQSMQSAENSNLPVRDPVCQR